MIRLNVAIFGCTSIYPSVLPIFRFTYCLSNSEGCIHAQLLRRKPYGTQWGFYIGSSSHVLTSQGLSCVPRQKKLKLVDQNGSIHYKASILSMHLVLSVGDFKQMKEFLRELVKKTICEKSVQHAR